MTPNSEQISSALQKVLKAFEAKLEKERDGSWVIVVGDERVALADAVEHEVDPGTQKRVFLYASEIHEGGKLQTRTVGLCCTDNEKSALGHAFAQVAVWNPSVDKSYTAMTSELSLRVLVDALVNCKVK